MNKFKIRIYTLILLNFLFIFCSNKPIEMTSQEININITSVAEWGGTPPNTVFPKHELKFLTIHHGGEDLEEGRDVSSYLRNLQSWSRSDKKWIDIPYHYIIDLDGNIYEGRNALTPGDTNTEYNPAGHLLTCLLGNYENIKPTEDQIESLTSLLAWQAAKYDIPLSTIAAHKDYAETACPGKNLYPLIQDGTILSKAITKLGKVKNK